MGDQLRPLRVNAVELLRQPGAVRAIDLTIGPAAVDVAHERLAGDVRIDLELESTNDAITVTGTISAPWEAPCRRCLRELDGVAVAEVDELYQREVTDEQAWPIEGGQLDLVPLVRQATLLELDAERLCAADCRGLCPVCGIDLNTGACGCVTDVRDERWAALDGLVIDD